MNASRLLISVVMAASLLSALNLGAAEEGEGYTDVGFIQSLEDLLRSQAGLLSSFEFLMHQTPTNLTDTLMFLDSFEDLLRRPAVLFDSRDRDPVDVRHNQALMEKPPVWTGDHGV